MSWEWSHTQEAYRDAELNLRDLSTNELLVIAAEWYASEPTKDDDGELETGFDDARYARRLAELQAEVASGVLAGDILADWIWEKASEQASCSNGGWQAYVCPYQCHVVSFDRTEEHTK